MWEQFGLRRLKENNYRRGCFRILLLSCCFILSFNQAFANNLSLFREIVKVNSSINSIDAEIIQHIYTPEHFKEVFRGRYRADNLQRFRVDYTSPSRQIVVNDGKRLFWYYPEDKLLYRIGRKDNVSAGSKINPLMEFLKDYEEKFDVNYLGEQLFGFFKLTHQFVIKDKKKGHVIDIYVDTKKKVILAKIVKDVNGIEIIKEFYRGYERINNIYFPSTIDIYARTAMGTTRNTTEYSNVDLNYNIPNSIFKVKFPKNVKIRYMQE